MTIFNRREFLALGLQAALATPIMSWPSSVGQIGETVQDSPLPLRYSCFYQVSLDSIAYYADQVRGLPNDENHVHVFSHSHASVFADRSLADYIHDAGPSFTYAPAFNLNRYSGWYTADEAQLAAWGREFRDAAIAAGADYFGFNELPSNASSDPQMRNQVMLLLAYLNEPDDQGNQLEGIFFMTHRPSMPENWNGPASDFWQRVDETSALVVAEHYHGHGFVCTNTETFLSNHFFAMRDWLNRSGEPPKVRIANSKFTVLHSSRFGPGPSGWQGGDSNRISLAQFQRNLSKCAKVTRNRAGGFNRIAFAPLATVYTNPGVHPRIRLLLNWHYNQDRDGVELLCVDQFPGNCRC